MPAGDRKTIVYGTLDLGAVADVEVAWEIPADASEILARLSTAATWRFATTSGVVAVANGGFPLASNESLSFEGPTKAQTLYLAHDNAGAETLHFSYCLWSWASRS